MNFTVDQLPHQLFMKTSSYDGILMSRLWETLHLLTLVLHCWVRVKPLRLNTILLVLGRTLSRVAQTTV
jgi:hypothetical protein